ncbi:MAG: hypothetical protein Q9187_002945, partial [Circinaria calcarea]
MDTGIIGPVTVMESFVSNFGPRSPTVHGLIVSAISSFFAGRLADRLGRPKAIAIGALIFGLGAALEAGAVSIAMFVVGRCIEGIGEGLYLGTLVVYTCEISPPSQRGRLSTGPQLLTTLGLVAGFFTCYGTGKMESSLAWRTPFVILACLSGVFSMASIFWLVPSPRWLTFRGLQFEASAAWDVLEVGCGERQKAENQQSGDTNAVELQSPTTSTDSPNRDPVPTPKPATKSSFCNVFSRDVRTRTGLVVFMMGMQQFSGIDGVLYVSLFKSTHVHSSHAFQAETHLTPASTLLSSSKKAGLASSEASFLASGVSAIVIFGVTIPALFLADKWGRRHNTVYGGVGLSAIMFLMGGLYAGNAVYSSFGAGRWVVIISIYIFIVIYSISWAVGIKIYA